VNIAVIGAGCGGQAIAGFLASKGNKVNLFNRSLERILPLMDQTTIELQGEIHAKGMLNHVTTDIGEAIAGTKLIMVVTTATGHDDVARLLAPHLKEGQTIVLNPGRTFGSLEFMNTLLAEGLERESKLLFLYQFFLIIAHPT
jgi:opine dehydrogenase